MRLRSEATAALHHAGVPAAALSVVLHDLTTDRTMLRWQQDQPVNPASLVRLPTTAAALDRLGPACTATACGEPGWPVPDPEAASCEARLLQGLWREMGGTRHGGARAGLAPAGQASSFELRTPALAERVRT